jgi:predicted nucleotidyltransferase
MEVESNNDAGDTREDTIRQGATIAIGVPAPNADLYRYKATNPVLHFLVENPYAKQTIRELSRLTDYSHPAVKNAVDVLAANDIVHVEAEGNQKQISINRSRITKPDDSVLTIPQPEFHAPVREAVGQLRSTLDDVKGIIVFGSVARGTADRQSDIDLWVLVQEDRGTNQRQANEIAKTVENERFSGDRYEFQILVESARSALNVGDRLTEILISGITIVDTQTLDRFKQEVLDDAG